MRVRFKDKPDVTGSASRFNVHALAEIIFYFDDADGFGGCDTVFCRDVEVFVERLQAWKSFGQAEKDRDIITDNYNTVFFEPRTEADRERGFTL